MNELPIGISSIDIPIGFSSVDLNSAHLLFETPLQEFTVVEGLLLCIFVVLVLGGVYKLITR